MSITYPNINFNNWCNFQKHGFNRIDLKLADLLCEKHNFCTDCLFLISTIQNLDSIRKNNISKLLLDPTVVGRENSRRQRLSRSVFSHKFSSHDISQMGTDIEDPSGENVHDMKENNIFEYRSDPTMEVGVIAVGVTTINMSSLHPLSKLSLALTSHSNRK